MKKIVVIGMVCVMLTGLFAGCGTQDPMTPYEAVIGTEEAQKYDEVRITGVAYHEDFTSIKWLAYENGHVVDEFLYTTNQPVAGGNG